jgi:tetratricopeptide (TPR) repeat protein
VKHRHVAVRSGRLVAALLLFLTSAPAQAADEAKVLRLRAKQMTAEGRCAEALPVLERAHDIDPTDVGVLVLQGRCRIDQGDYRAAMAPLQEARRLEPDNGDAALFLGVAAFHAGNLSTASPALDDATRLMPDNAQAHLYYGLVLLERAEGAEAATSLERASTLDPSFDPVSTYFAGRAWEAARQRERAEKALEQVIDQAPGTPWAAEAERALNEGVVRLPGWVSLSGGFEYNTNVILQGNGVVPAPGISDESDWAGVWSLDTGTEIFRTPEWAGGIALSYFANAYGDLHDFDTQYPSVYAWLDRALNDKNFLRLTADTGYAWVGYDPFLFPIGTTLGLHTDFEKIGSGHTYFRWDRNDYKFPVITLDQPVGTPPSARNQDGNWYLGGYDHRYNVNDSLAIRGGGSIGHYDSNLEFTHTAYQAWIGARQELPCDLVFDGFFSYVRGNYANSSTFRDPVSGLFPSDDRRDNLFQVGAVLDHYITDRLVISARYRYVNNESNTRVYDYDQHVIGGFLTFELGPGRVRRRFDQTPGLTEI